jgi:transcriptional regulator of acetoin/glycerol metabolism
VASTVPEEARSLFRAREDFLSGGDPRTAVSQGLLASWRRSALSGARPDVPGLPYSEGVDKQGSLYAAVAPVLDRLTERFDGTRTAMLLADPQARIVARWVGDRDLLRMMDRTSSAPGFSLTEKVCGTNGLGSVLEERRPVVVVGAEHFADRFLDYACYGVPIRQPGTQRIQGVLTFMCPAAEATPLMLPFVQQTCEVIQDRLLAMSSQHYRALLDAYVTALRSTRRAVLALNEQTIIISSAASKLLGDVDPVQLWNSTAAAISAGAVREVVWPLATRHELNVRIRAVHMGASMIGAVVELCARTGGSPLSPGRQDDGTAPMHPERLLLRRLGGSSRAWLQTVRQAARAVNSRHPVLIVGEAGTGKLELARAIHEAGEPGGALHVLNAVLASVDGLGAWLGQVRQLMAEPGTLAITHLEALLPGHAAAFAALLDELPGTAPARIIATAVLDPATTAGAHSTATSPHMARLAVHKLTTPPLRERLDDIPDLTARLLDRHRRGQLRFSGDALRTLAHGNWPGNIRQLDMLVRTLAAECGSGVVTVEDLPAELVQAGRRTLTQLERLEMQAIVTAMRDAAGNKKVAAAELGISRSTLYRKLRAFHLDRVADL